MAAAQVTGIVLCGGRARRMGGCDKGLLPLAGRPLAAHVAAALRPQVERVLLNANRHRDAYLALGYPVIADDFGNYAGPLAGMLRAMRAPGDDYLVTVPCDSPLLAADLVARLWQCRQESGARICHAHDGERAQPVFALLDRGLRADLEDYLRSGERRIEPWYQRCGAVAADFAYCPRSFHNLNTPRELARLAAEMNARRDDPAP